MKNVCKLTACALLLTGVSLAQQEVSPDRFEGEAAKQPIKVKRVVKTSETRMAQKKHHASKSANKTVAMARVPTGN